MWVFILWYSLCNGTGAANALKCVAAGHSVAVVPRVYFHGVHGTHSRPFLFALMFVASVIAITWADGRPPSAPSYNFPECPDGFAGVSFGLDALRCFKYSLAVFTSRWMSVVCSR